MIRLNRRSTDLISICILIIIYVILFLQMLNRADSNDFTSYLLSAKALISGDNPYHTSSPFAYIYPLTFAFILIPFTLLPEILVQVLWYGANVFMLYISSKHLMMIFDKKDNRYSLPVIAAASVFMLNIIQNNLVNAQVNILIIFLCLIFFIYYKKGNEYFSALALALAVSIKILPVVFIFFLLYQKESKILLLTIIFTILLLMLPAISAGENIISFYNYYINILITAGNADNHNSLTDGMFFNPAGLINYILSSSSQKVLLYSVNFILVGIIYWILLKSYRIDDWIFFPAFLISFLLVSPISETHHLIYLFPCIFILIIKIFQMRSIPGLTDKILLFLIVVSLFLGHSIHILYVIFILSTLIAYLRTIIIKKS